MFFFLVSAIGHPVNRSVLLAMTEWDGHLFMSGGFNGVTLGRLVSLSVPSDPCALLPTPEACNTTTGSCIWCRGTCASSDAAERYPCFLNLNYYYASYLHCKLSLLVRMGCYSAPSSCSPTPRQPDQCRRLKTCSECLARHPKTFSVPSQVSYTPYSKSEITLQIKYS